MSRAERFIVFSPSRGYWHYIPVSRGGGGASEWSFDAATVQRFMSEERARIHAAWLAGGSTDPSLPSWARRGRPNADVVPDVEVRRWDQRGEPGLARAPEPIARPDVAGILATLKDFQRDSVEYIFDQLFRTSATDRFLLADEVGLGKTMVARGVIAKVVDHLWRDKARIDIAYICSNGEIARQNINRLNISRHSAFQTASRLTLLPMQVRSLEKHRLNFIALTPGTSFDLKSSLGTAEERWMLYWLLRRAWPKITRGVGAKNVLEGNKNRQTFRAWIRQYDPDASIDPGLQSAFVERLHAHDRLAEEQGEPTYRRQFRALCEEFYGRPQHNVPWKLRRKRNELVSRLRALLAATCIGALDPDLIVLDEFQRFKDLLRSDSEPGQLARHLFETPGARVLMLSATPYKMYTVSHEQEDDHYADFLDTLRFLFNDEHRTRELASLLRQYRKSLYQIGDSPSQQLHDIRRQIEQRLRAVIARTERLAVSADRDGMLREVSNGHIPLAKGDVRAYVHLQGIARLLDRGSVVDHWKSAPYLLNFMDNYELKRAFRRGLGDERLEPALRDRLARAPHLTLPWQAMMDYEPVEPHNPRVRRLVSDLLDNGSWRLLWLAPSLPYYRLQGPFADAALQAMTKRLIFSSWFVVPRSLSVLLSYEAERRMMLADPHEDTEYAAYARRGALLNFTRSQGRLAGMPVLAMLYPSPALARMGDALAISQELGADEPPEADAVLAQVRRRLTDPLARLARQHAQPTSGREDEAWYWAAPLLLDLQHDPEATRSWWADPTLASTWSDGAGDDGWADHIAEARRVLDGSFTLGRPPDDLADVLAHLALAGPANCALRALSRVAADEAVSDRPAIRHAAGRVAWGFRSLFNLPTSINLVRGMSRREPYWLRVVEYCLAGGLQSVLDEYAHMLRESLGLVEAEPDEAAAQIAEAIARAAGLHAATPQVDVIDADGHCIDITPQRVRARYAMRFGDERSDDATTRFRGDEVRQAFNSPFRPFVLVTTSVGQEGLDFHPYCHAVVHWNLPPNQVDLEQREGRVHRYKGHAVRRNVAERYGGDVHSNGQADVWRCMFDLAAQEPDRQSDLTPYWVYPNGRAFIERHVPTLPMSREITRMAALRRSLAIYRMVFGQPRQEDLLEHLLSRLPRERLMQELDALQIDLAPVTTTRR